MSYSVKTIHLRIKDKHAKLLLAQAKEVNMVWNFCNETSIKILDRENRFCSGYDLDKLTAGCTKEGLTIHAQSIQAIAKEYITRRRQFKKRRLNWRVSQGSKRSLGWIPIKSEAVQRDRMMAALSGFFGVLALLLTAVGVYGVIAYAVGRRTAEIGVRMALGATSGQVRWMVLRETLTLMAAGAVIGVPVSFACARVLK